jgi:hypothetical protein
VRHALLTLLLLPALAPACALAETPGEISVMSATMQNMAGDIQVMSAGLGSTNASLGTTNATLDNTNSGLDGMDGKLAAMTEQLQGLRGAMDGMQAQLGTMVGQMEGLGVGMDGMRSAMEETNRLLVEVLNGINATSSGLTTMSRQLDVLPPRILDAAMPKLAEGAARAGSWLVPALVALAGAWATLVVLLWRIHGVLLLRRAAAPSPEAARIPC